MPPDQVLAEVVHRLPGRLRLRVRSDLPPAAIIEELLDRLAALEGVSSVRYRRATGSLLIAHDPGTDDLLERLAAIGLEPFASTPGDAPAGKVGAGDKMTARHVLQGGLIAVAIIEALKGNVFPPAITLLRYAGALSVLDGKTD